MTPTLSYQVVYAARCDVRPAIPMHLIGTIAIAIVLGFKVWLMTEITGVSYDISRVQDESIVLDSKRRELELKRSVLLRPDNLKGQASARLGLATLQPDQARRVGY